MQETHETHVQFLGLDDCLEEEMATHSSILAWKIPWAKEPGRAIGYRAAKSQTQLNQQHFQHFHYLCHQKAHNIVQKLDK